MTKIIKIRDAPPSEIPEDPDVTQDRWVGSPEFQAKKNGQKIIGERGGKLPDGSEGHFKPWMENRPALVSRASEDSDDLSINGIDWRAVDEMAQMMMTGEEISLVLGISPITLRRWIAREFEGVSMREYLNRGYAKGKMRLRAKQFKVALEKGDKTLSIWLGKNSLGQSDQIQHDIEADLNLKIEFVGEEPSLVDGEVIDPKDLVIHELE